MNRFNNQVYFWAHMLDEAMQDKCMLTEDRESKNMHKARKWIEQNHPEVIGQKLDNGSIATSQKIIEEIRNIIPNVRMCDCKFLLGLTRLYFDLQSDSEIQSKFNKLNKMLKIICTAHEAEYDNDLNGMSFDVLDRKFSGAVQKELSNDKQEIDKLVLLKQNDYKIVPINSFDEAKKYGKYTSWCVTHYEDMFNSYTKKGIGRFYFCLKPGFQNVKEVKRKGCPMDEYGKSMIAISVNDDGSLNTCTCRWNHDNGGNDNMMDTKQISEFFGVNFYKTFVPYSGQELLKKYEKIRARDDKVCKQMGWIRCISQDLDELDFYISLDQNQNIQKYIDIGINCFIHNGKFCTINDGKLINGSPKEVKGYINCNSLNITSLEGAPQKVLGFYCNECNSLTSLEGAPQEVEEDFQCIGCNSLTSLKGAPQEVGGNFNCSNTNITSLEGAPQKVLGFYCNECNSLTSLEGAPQEVKSFNCRNTKVTNIQIEAYKEFLKHPTPDHIDDTGHYKP